jgi:phage baseplate assembly protein W
MAQIEVWSDLDARFLTDSQGAIKKVTNVDSVITSIDNILGTARLERVMLPDFAIRLKDILFEPMTEEFMQYLSDQVRSAVEAWDDRVTVIAVDVWFDPDHNLVEFRLEFAIKSFQNIFTYTKTVNF